MKQTFSTEFITEPLLIFGGGMEEKDPKKGLKMGGPFTYSDEKTSLQNIRIGLVGNRDGISLTNDILEMLGEKIPSHHEKNEWLFPAYPGMNQKSKFHCTISRPKIFQAQISDDLELSKIVNTIFPGVNERIAFGVNLFAEKIKEIAENDDKPNVIICTLPKIIETYCGISEKTRGAKTLKLTKHEKELQRLKKLGQTFISEWGFEISNFDKVQDRSFDFRNALKGKIIQYGIPIQILRETTCKNILDFNSMQKHTVQDPCTFAWNLSTALLYKSNGKPWRLAKLPHDTCYIGISFFKDKLNPVEGMQISMAQIFLHTGEGLVLRGNEVYADEYTGDPHLKKKQAADLLSKAIDLYKEKAKQNPGKVVIHKTTQFLQDEKDGFNEAISQNEIFRKDFVTINTHSGINFMRVGQFPPLRGSIIYLGNDHFLLYSSGYTSQIRTYPGHSIPTPLKIKHEGDSTSQEIAKDILGLTKLDWNTASFSTSIPITIKFATEVGKVLSELPDKEIRQTSYRFFM